MTDSHWSCEIKAARPACAECFAFFARLPTHEELDVRMSADSVLDGGASEGEATLLPVQSEPSSVAPIHTAHSAHSRPQFETFRVESCSSLQQSRLPSSARVRSMLGMAGMLGIRAMPGMLRKVKLIRSTSPMALGKRRCSRAMPMGASTARSPHSSSTTRPPGPTRKKRGKTAQAATPAATPVIE